MLFSSPRFFVFLIVTLLVLRAIGPVALKKNALALASCFFYAAWDWRYLGLLLVVSVIDYGCAARIDVARSRRVAKAWLVASVASNIGILAYFKYYNFFVGTWNGVLGDFLPLPVRAILLPAGISFYTFKSMSYTIDVYRREIEPCRSHLDYVTFVTFFPELIAGPIVRASVFLPQMGRSIGPTAERLRVGLSFFVLGLFKKMVIADAVARGADLVFAHPDQFDAMSTWGGVLAYAVQIYADFSGYSDMAIGTAKMIGYDLPENFSMPYASPNIAVFWQRWHITLSSWLRDYLYISLGGNRRGMMRTYGNLMLTMLLGGLWHGASWNFVAWGALHGGALALHRWFSRTMKLALPKALSTPLTLAFLVLAWVPFRAASFADTAKIVRGLFGARAGTDHFVAASLVWSVPLVVVAHGIASVFTHTGRLREPIAAVLGWFDIHWMSDPISGPAFVVGWRTMLGSFVLVTAFLLVFFFAEVSASPFIYFQF